jgi:serine/threonine-protein kinase ULK2
LLLLLLSSSHTYLPILIFLVVLQSPDRTTCYLALELCDMGDLNSWLAAQPGHRVTEQVAQQLIRQLAAGLYCLRGLNVVHRDLKPANILLCRSQTDVPTLKIADFGFARETQNSALLESFVGTPLYMVCRSQ